MDGHYNNMTMAGLYHYKHWYYFPDTVDGAVFSRDELYANDSNDLVGVWLNNTKGNYLYYYGLNTVFIRNNPPVSVLYSRTFCLPTDRPELLSGINDIEGKVPGIDYEYTSGSGLLKGGQIVAGIILPIRS